MKGEHQTAFPLLHLLPSKSYSGPSNQVLFGFHWISSQRLANYIPKPPYVTKITLYLHSCSTAILVEGRALSGTPRREACVKLALSELSQDVVNVVRGNMAFAWSLCEAQPHIWGSLRQGAMAKSNADIGLNYRQGSQRANPVLHHI